MLYHQMLFSVIPLFQWLSLPVIPLLQWLSVLPVIPLLQWLSLPVIPLLQWLSLLPMIPLLQGLSLLPVIPLLQWMSLLPVIPLLQLLSLFCMIPLLFSIYQCRRKRLTPSMEGTVLRMVCVCMCAFTLLYCWISDLEDQEWWFTFIVCLKSEEELVCINTCMHDVPTFSFAIRSSPREPH